MPDRVREAVFAMLGSYYDVPGSLPPLHVADVFAGSGSMGLEALSRGAASCRFFESDRSALKALRENLERFALDTAAVDTRDAWVAAGERGGPSFDLVLLDPPYRDARDTSHTGPVMRLLERLEDRSDGPLTAVLHHPRAVTWSVPRDGRWRIVTDRTLGSSGISVFAL